MHGVLCLDYPFQMRDPASLVLYAREAIPVLASLIEQAEKGDRSATEALFAALYSELHQLAKRELARRGGGATISVTTLLARSVSRHGRAQWFPIP